MKLAYSVVAAALSLGLCGAAFAQAGTVQRDVNQQNRIEQGLQSGQLTTREASRLENEQARVERDQSRAMKDGKLSPQEKARLQREQNQVSRDIYREKHDAQTGNPNSASSQRMQADVQRNVNQQRRIEQGVQSNSLTTREAGHLEGSEAHVDKKEARAGSDGKITAHEQARVQKAENRESRRIYRQKHDSQKK
jgi:hypothetical protein